jgi:anti-sigma factor RsiW
MKFRQGEPISPPTPEMLAAYVDGEFEGNHLLLAHKRAIEAWLESHPQAAEEVLAWRRLKRLMQETGPEEPPEEAWDLVLSGIQANLTGANAKPLAARPVLPLWVRGAAAAAILVMVSALALLAHPTAERTRLLSWLGHLGTENHAPGDHGFPAGEKGFAANAASQKKKPVVEPFAVLNDDEVEIRHIEGPDINTLVVGPAVDGPLPILKRGDFVLNSVEPAEEDEMVPDIQIDQGPPIVWARNENEMTEP